jgi:Fe-S-cluster containining protein
MPDDLFYAKGLCFSCTRCSSCCRFDPGYVFLSKKDADSLARALDMTYTDFVEVYCRWVDGYEGKARLSLKEKANYDCIFWKEGCTVYAERPGQCRTFPFWPDILRSGETWNNAALSCPGIGKGERIDPSYIERRLWEQLTETIIEKVI